MSNLTQAISEVTTPKPSRLARKLKPVSAPVVSDNPKEELRKLVNMHKRWTNTAKALVQMSTDRKNRETGESILCTVPQDVRLDLAGERALNAKGKLGGCAKRLQDECKSLETRMLQQLRQIPIYNEFLSHVYGVGPIAAAYLVAMVKIEKSVKPSQLWRYCGNACGPDGKREYRVAGGGPKEAGGTGTYNDELKCRIWQFMTAALKNASKKTAGRPNGTTTKYLRRWNEASLFRRTNGREKGAHDAGRRKATDLFLEDLYVIWRTLEGLPVWPDLYSVRRGFHHGGKTCVNEGRVLTLAEAWETVGPRDWIEGRAAEQPLVWKNAPVEEMEEFDE